MDNTFQDNFSATTRAYAFGSDFVAGDLFSINSGIPVRHALQQAEYLLNTAKLLSAESVDADMQLGRALNCAILHLIEAGSGLIVASLAGLERQ